MRDAVWILGQYVVAWLLVAASGLGFAGELLGWWHLGLGVILCAGVLPGAALLFAVNAFAMSRHGRYGLARVQKVVLPVQLVALAGISAAILADQGAAIFVLVVAVPIYVILALVLLGIALERARGLDVVPERLEPESD